MHQYKNDKLPNSFANMFSDIPDSNLQTRHNDYNYLNEPANKSYLENFPRKKLISSWNALEIDLKATAEAIEFKNLLNESLLSKYNLEPDCNDKNCQSCEL